MSMVIAHNIPALQTYNIVNNTSNALQKSIAKLSSGLRINSAADDAAGLAISEKMRSQIRGLDRAVANTQDGISLIQTAEGALSETHSILQRMRELSVQAANDTLTQQDRAYIQEEVDQLKDEITRVGNTTQFNKKKLINGESSALWSSNDLETKALIRGSLREVDQFGQKKSIEGNYKIRIKADPGEGEVQKSDIMTIKHPNVLTDKIVKANDGIKNVEVDNMAPGSYSLQLGNSNTTGANTGIITGDYNVSGTKYTKTIKSGDSSAILSGELAASGGSAGSRVYSSTTVTFTYGNDELGSITYTTDPGDGTAVGTAVSAGTVATYIANHFDAIQKEANKKGITIDGIGSLATDGGEVTLTSIDNSDIKNLTISVVNSASPTGSTFAATMGNATQAMKTTTDADGNTVYDTEDITASKAFTVSSTTNNKLNGSILFEVTGTDDINHTITVKATATMLDQDGKNSTKTMDNIVLKENGDAVNLTDIFGGSNATGEETVTVKMNNGVYDAIKKDGKFVAFVTAGVSDEVGGGADPNAINVKLSGTVDEDWDDAWENGPFGGSDKNLTYYLNGDNLGDTEVHFKNYILNSKTGTVSEGDVILTTDKTFTTTSYIDDDGKKQVGALVNNSSRAKEDVLASFTSSYIGKTASGEVKLRDLDKFWNSEGTFMLDDAKTLTLNQGDGKTASITLYANDTLDDVATKINNAIASELGQSKYVDKATKFATFVSEKDDYSEAVPGTFVIRSVVPGAQGEITFSGDQQILDALSLNTIQESKETTYSVDVLDEHTGKVLAQSVKTTGNVLHGVIHENVDVEFGALKGVSAKWNDTLNKFTYTSEMEETTLHLADNTTVLQIGANEGEDLAMDIGDMRSHALGLDGVNMMSHDRAARSITIIDNAIDRVSTQRAKLGAYQNRLEYTANNLTTASENLTSAESRIRDADMAKEMMQFTKLNIMLQAGNSMLAQANQQPQNVLSLIR